MKVLIMQHSAGDFSANAGDAVKNLGIATETIRLDRGDHVPSTVSADAIMTFGGAISITSDSLPEWVRQEQELLYKYVHEGRRVFAICLGSQMLASALGARVSRNPQPEVGWLNVRKTPSADTCPVIHGFPDEFRVLQWHEDTFEIPPGATHLFESDACRHQGYGIDDRVFGFQFHLEANERTVNTFFAASNKWKQPGDTIQSEKEIFDGIEKHLPRQKEILDSFIKRWLGK